MWSGLCVRGSSCQKCHKKKDFLLYSQHTPLFQRIKVLRPQFYCCHARHKVMENISDSRTDCCVKTSAHDPVLFFPPLYMKQQYRPQIFPFPIQLPSNSIQLNFLCIAPGAKNQICPDAEYRVGLSHGILLFWCFQKSGVHHEQQCCPVET